MTQQTNIRLEFDFKYRDGFWAKSFRVNRGGIIQIYHPKLARLWAGIRVRCNPDGSHRKIRPSYLNVVNKFTYQSLGDWAQTQEGYFMIESSGKYWHLDKDILGGGKVYSEDTCCFVPNFINTLLTANKSDKGRLPIGVGSQKRSLRFIARCHDGVNKESKFLGFYNTPEDAHKAYQRFKVEVIRNSAKRYLNLDGSRKDVYHRLLDKSDKIYSDMLNSIETLKI